MTVDLGKPGQHAFLPSSLRFETGKLYKLVLRNASEDPHYFTSHGFSQLVYTRKVQVVQTRDGKPTTLAEFKGAIRSLARLFDIAAAPENRELMTYASPKTGKPVWRTPLVELPSWSGAMVTAGGLVFTGNTSGDFVALEEATGKILWQFKTASGVTSQPITYTYKGKQYVSILSGLGGGTSSRRETGGKVLPAGSVWTFALMD